MSSKRRLWLKAWRDHRVLSQVRLAELSGVSERAIVRAEPPNAPIPRVSTLHKLAAALEIQPADLFRKPKERE